MYKTCEYWVHAMCLGITDTSKAPLSRIGWKCLSTYPSIKNIKTSKEINEILYYYGFFFQIYFYLLELVDASTDIQPFLVVRDATLDPQFGLPVFGL